MINLLNVIKNSGDILGMNDRNFSYLALNKPANVNIADNKILTKTVLKKSEILFPEIYKTIKNEKQLSRFNFSKLPDSFVIKPANGLSGAGINIYYNRAKDGSFILANRQKDSLEDVKAHIKNILDGQFSIGTTPKPSVAIIEERIKMHSVFRLYSYRGIPDVRIIVYKNVPVMAMLRLPTESTKGKANLSLGAIGVGIDMGSGITTTAYKDGKILEKLPGTNLRLSGIKIPYWNKILHVAHNCQVATDIKLLGVDIIIDKEKGPMVVELNARPGLAIQIANQAGLKERLERVKKLKNISEARAVRLAKDLFGGEIEDEIEQLSGREVIGLKEKIFLTGKDGSVIKAFCKIDTGAHGSSIDYELLRELGYGSAIDYYKKVVPEGIENMEAKKRAGITRKLREHEEIERVIYIKSASGSDYRILVNVPAKIRDKEFIIQMTASSRTHLTEPVLIGGSVLKYFLIDSTKKEKL
jgi:alpha-L-glutamate ligase-like protein